MSCLGPVLGSLLLSSISVCPECWQLTASNYSPTVKVKVTLRLTVSQSVSLGAEPHLGPMTRYLLLFDSYGLVFVGRPLWREDGSVFGICCWPLPAQSFLGPSPLGLTTILYCLRFETSLFVASWLLKSTPSNRVFSSGIEDTFSHGCIFHCNNLIA
jgi:hypothetical protein